MNDSESPSPEVEVKPDDGTQVGEPNEEADGESPSGPLPPPPNEPQADDAQVAFTHHELKGFQDVAPFLRPNPRHLKRLVNVYRLVRSLAVAKNERAILDKPVATIRWFVVCAQGPYTSHAMLWQFSEKLEEWEEQIPDDPPAGDPLLYLLDQVSPHLSRKRQHELDDDPESLRKLPERDGEQLTWEELRRIRQYTVNFNPAVEAEMWALTQGEQPVESADARPSDLKTSQDTPT